MGGVTLPFNRELKSIHVVQIVHMRKGRLSDSEVFGRFCDMRDWFKS